VAAGMYRST